MARPRIGLVPIPIEHDGVHYPSRKALAQHLAAIKGGAIGTWITRLSRFDGDVARALTNKAAPPIRLTYRGMAFASRKALAQHLAATLGGCPETWSGRLQRAANAWRWRLRRRVVGRLTDGGKDRAPTNQAAI